MNKTILPPELKKQFTAAEISAKVAELGRSISGWAETVSNKHAKGILAIPILRGGIFFFADLVRQIPYSVEIAPMRVWAYQTDQFAAQRDELKLNVSDLDAKGRHILMLDDICDSGRTLRLTTQALRERGALEVKTAVLIRRSLSHPTFEPDWVAFHYEGPEWFVGYGMEDQDRWSNLPDIYTMPARLD